MAQILKKVDPFKLSVGERIKIVREEELFYGVVQNIRRTTNTIIFDTLITVFAVRKVKRSRWKPKVVSFRSTVNNILDVFIVTSTSSDKDDVYSKRRAQAGTRNQFVKARETLQTPYEILGVRDGASVDICKAAFRELARKFHPDISKEANAAKRFVEISLAWGKIYKEASSCHTN